MTELDLAGARAARGRARAVPVRPAAGRAARSSRGPTRASHARRSSSGTGRAPTPTATSSWADRRERAAARARPLMLEPPDRERWLDAVGPELLEGPIADELAGIPSEEVRVPFAVQGLIGTLAGPVRSGHAFVSLYHDLGEAAGPPGAWGFARGGMGAVDRVRCAPPRRPRAREVHLDAAGGAGADRRAARDRASCSRTATRCRPGRCCRTPIRAHGGLAGVRRAGGLDAGRARREGDAAAGRPAGLPVVAGGGAVARGRSTSASRSTTFSGPRDDARAGRPAARAVDRGRVPDRGGPDAGAGGPPRAVAVLPVLPARRGRRGGAPTPRSRASRGVPGLPDRIVDRLVLGPSSSRSASASPAATSSTARCCRAAFEAARRRASGASRGSTWPARARTPAARSPVRPATSPRGRCSRIWTDTMRGRS